MNKELNNQCPACECVDAAAISCRDGVFRIACYQCGFEVNSIAEQAGHVIWAWETLPRPRKVKAKRKASKAGGRK